MKKIVLITLSMGLVCHLFGQRYLESKSIFKIGEKSNRIFTEVVLDTAYFKILLLSTDSIRLEEESKKFAEVGKACPESKKECYFLYKSREEEIKRDFDKLIFDAKTILKHEAEAQGEFSRMEYLSYNYRDLSQYNISSKTMDSISILYSKANALATNLENQNFEVSLLINSIKNDKTQINTDNDFLVASAEKLISYYVKVKRIAHEQYLYLQDLYQSSIEINQYISRVLRNELDDESKKKSILSSTPQLASNFKSFRTGINLLGHKKFGENSTNEIGLFTTANLNGDSSFGSIILNPEYSKFGCFIRGVLHLSENANSILKRAALNYSFMYNGKEIKLNNSNINYSQFQGKLGLEYIVIKDILSLYYNKSLLTPITNTKIFKEATSISKSFTYYDDFGVKFLVDFDQNGENKSGSTGLFVDINFIRNRNEIITLSKNEDKIIPSMRIGLQRQFVVGIQ